MKESQFLLLLILTARCLSHAVDGLVHKYVSGDNKDEQQGKDFLDDYNVRATKVCTNTAVASWDYVTNITETNKNKMLSQSLVSAAFEKEAWRNATAFAWTEFQDPLVRRQFRFLSHLGVNALEEDDLGELTNLVAEMEDIYSTAKICPYVKKSSVKRRDVVAEEITNATEKGQQPDAIVLSFVGEKSIEDASETCNLSLEPDIVRIIGESRDYEELLHVWKAFRDETGKKMRKKYIRYIELFNIAADLNGFEDAGAMWRELYESDTFLINLEFLWNQLRPLYEQLHAYVRRKLITLYGEDKIKADGPIPAHLFGTVSGDSWEPLQYLTTPYPDKPFVDVTNNMRAKNMTVEGMFRLSEEFFTSLGLEPMTDLFWERSVLKKPRDREIVCHASAWDFCDGKDFRIKQCSEVTMPYLVDTHHEMGHVQYFQQYAHQPILFRTGANPGFHEAIGDVLALSVSTPQHLKKVGLLDRISDDVEGDLNHLFSMAASKVAFLPMGYLIDLWRWQIFSGKRRIQDMNRAWWDLRLKYQGLCPGVERSESDLDAGSKFHVPASVPYIRYFVSTIIQFQFYQALCDEAGHQGPLYKCDIYRSKEAGKLFKSVMQLGASRPWPEVMKVITKGKTDRMEADALLTYFQPLTQWLQEQNRNETLGWKSENSFLCP